MLKKKIAMFSLFCAAFLFAVTGCNNSKNPVSPNGTNSPGSVSMMSKYSNNTASGMNKSSSVNAIDSIEITSARIVLKDIKLEGVEKEHESEDSRSGMNKSDCRDEVNFKTGPVLLNLNLSGSLQQVTVSNIPYGTYRKVKFKIHTLQQSDLDSLSIADRVVFSDFLKDGGYSIIIEGNTYSNGTATPFTYKSDLNADMEIEFSPVLVVDDNNPNPNLTLEISSEGWFKSYDGTLLDPGDSNNSAKIEANIQKSVHIYKDCNRDGHEDSD